MTETPASKSSSSPTEAEAQAAQGTEEQERSYAPLFAKGCGWLLLSVVLAVGVAVAGHGDVESWGSALAGVVILLLVLGSSGLTGVRKSK